MTRAQQVRRISVSRVETLLLKRFKRQTDFGFEFMVLVCLQRRWRELGDGFSYLLGIPQSKRNRSLIGDLSELLESLQGSVYFEKELSATNAQRSSTPGTSRRFGQLPMPRWFVSEHGNKFRRAVVLRSDLSCNKPWPHRLSFCTSRSLPEVTFAGAQWRAFLTCHGLIQGDNLIFSLTTMSQFQVYMFNGLGDPKGPQTLHTPMKWSEQIKRPLQETTTLQSLAYNCKSEREESMVNKMSTSTATCTTNRVTIEDYEFVDAGCASNDTSSCQNSSDNNTPSQLPVEQDFLSKGISCLPSFSRRLGAINVYRLEIPKDFVSAYRRHLHDPVQLQGIHEDSPVKTAVQCVCHMANGCDRIYLRGAGWDDFVSQNELRFGQELVFTLAGDSCFTVREEISWNPRTGLNLGSRAPMSVQKN